MIVVKNGGLERDIERREIHTANQTADKRHDDIRNKTRADFAERRRDDNADGHIHDVAAGDKGLEFIQKFLHLGCLSLCLMVGVSDGPIFSLAREKIGKKRALWDAGCISPGRCVPASGRPTSVTLLRRERL